MAALTTATILAAAAITATVGVSAYQANQQRKDAASAASRARKEQNALLKEAQDRASSEESTNAQAIARARQKALAASISAQGRVSTIKTGSDGLIGDQDGTQKTLIGE